MRSRARVSCCTVRLLGSNGEGLARGSPSSRARLLESNLYTRLFPRRTTRKEVSLVPEQEIKRLNLHIDSDLHSRFKSATALQGKNMTDVLLEFIQQYVKDNPLQAPKKGRRG